jgi:hypothetical protein
MRSGTPAQNGNDIVGEVCLGAHALSGREMPVQKRRHAPVQVIDGNYEKMAGVCPWWDSKRRN